jgi:DNA replication and repair protein RecF
MMLHNLSVTGFKNYRQLSLDFKDHRFVGFTGPNGVGKTNLLDAIHYLSLGKSYFNPSDSYNIREGDQFFNVRGYLQKDDEVHEVFCSYMPGRKKVIKQNGAPYDKITDHIGQFPNVIITPYDVKLINEGSEERRRFIDRILSQIDKTYLNNISQYQRYLNQRNAQLKELGEKGSHDLSLIQVYDDNLAPLGDAIYQRRAEFLQAFNPVFNRYYSWLSNDQETVALTYESPLAYTPMADLLKQNLEKDRLLQRTSTGIHRDDLAFTIFDRSLKRFGSQGQQKSYLIALKLAQYEMLRNAKNEAPLLLLDDIYDRLDDNRVNRLMETITEHPFSQVFLTDTAYDRVMGLFEPLTATSRIFQLPYHE